MLFNSKAFLSAALLLGSALGQTTTTTAGNNAECTRSYASILASAPKPNSQLASAITSFAGGLRQTGAPHNNLNPVSEACALSSGLPQSLRSDFDAYVTKVISFVSVSSSEIDALITNCVATGEQGARYTSLVNSLATHTGPLCQATGGTTGTTGTGTQTTAVTGGTSIVGTSTTAATTSVPRGEGAKPTGVLAGAAAAAGALGAAILL
ncbi:hypothetical protein GGS21DRAFT_494155 [Xylaria nigripes]|nr:hypothetical protein GGS21DRAFT_494155 [Xylaria nigripes]